MKNTWGEITGNTENVAPVTQEYSVNGTEIKVLRVSPNDFSLEKVTLSRSNLTGRTETILGFRGDERDSTIAAATAVAAHLREIGVEDQFATSLAAQDGKSVVSLTYTKTKPYEMLWKLSFAEYISPQERDAGNRLASELNNAGEDHYTAEMV